MTVEGKLQIGDANPVLAGNAAERFGALAVSGGEFAGMLEEVRRIVRSRDERVGRQNGLACELGWKLLLVGCSRAGDQKNK